MVYISTLLRLQALKAVVLFDTCGAVFRWSIFDHAAHLGGALFGV
jgi:rhomboid-like protein